MESRVLYATAQGAREWMIPVRELPRTWCSPGRNQAGRPLTDMPCSDMV